jgi:hypothetical protein
MLEAPIGFQAVTPMGILPLIFDVVEWYSTPAMIVGLP